MPLELIVRQRSILENQQDLDLHESAMLVGMAKTPSIFNSLEDLIRY